MFLLMFLSVAGSLFIFSSLYKKLGLVKWVKGNLSRRIIISKLIVLLIHCVLFFTGLFLLDKFKILLKDYVYAISLGLLFGLQLSIVFYCPNNISSKLLNK